MSVAQAEHVTPNPVHVAVPTTVDSASDVDTAAATTGRVPIENDLLDDLQSTGALVDVNAVDCAVPLQSDDGDIAGDAAQSAAVDLDDETHALHTSMMAIFTELLKHSGRERATMSYSVDEAVRWTQTLVRREGDPARKRSGAAAGVRDGGGKTDRLPAARAPAVLRGNTSKN